MLALRAVKAEHDSIMIVRMHIKVGSMEVRLSIDTVQ